MSDPHCIMGNIRKYLLERESKMVLKYSAGWSLPGCLPEMVPGLFDTEEEAKAFVEEEQREAAAIYAEDEMADPYEYWVEPVQMTEEEVAAYEEDILL